MGRIPAETTKAWGDRIRRVHADKIDVACPACGAKVWNEKAHYVPGNYVTPAGWACPKTES
jgi:hypothetical protein